MRHKIVPLLPKENIQFFFFKKKILHCMYNSKPIIEASFDNKAIHGSPAVLFPSGLMSHNNEIILSIGVNDCSSFILRIPHNEISTFLNFDQLKP